MPHLTWFERRYVKPTWHLGAVTLFTLGLVVSVFFVHDRFRPRYREDTDPLVERASQQYYFELDPAGERFVLMLERIPLEDVAEDERAGPLGIGDTPSFRGTLAKHALEARDVGRRVVEGFASKLSAFERQIDGRYRLELKELGPGRYLRLEAQPLESCFAEPNLLSPARLERLLLVSELWESRAPPSDSLEPGPHPELVRTGLRTLSDALPSLRRPDEARRVTFEPESRALVQAWCRSSYEALPRDTPAASSETELSSLTAVGTALTRRLQQEIVEIAKAEITTGIWIYGPWRWFEIIFWVWFGVLTNALYGVGAIAVGMKQVTFEPRETQWMFARMLYAPLLAMIFFWIAESAIPFLGPEALLFNSTLLGLAIAFLIGMYPDNIHQLLATFFHRVLQSSKGADDRRKPKVQQVPVAVGSDPHSIPRLSDLADRIGSLVTAPLRKGAS